MAGAVSQRRRRAAMSGGPGAPVFQQIKELWQVFAPTLFFALRA